MKAILMVAGKGTRISSYINGIPKSLVDIGEGTKLLLHSIHMLKNNGINDITLVVGYRHKLIEDAVKDEQVNIVYNPFYSVTNSIASLYLAKNQLNDDMLLANGDVFWEDETLKRLLNYKDDVTMLVDKTKADTGDYFFNVDQDGRILAFGKELKREERNCEYVGICKIRKEFIRNFTDKLESMIENEEYNKWWENVCYDMSRNVPIHTLDVDGAFWAEVDRIEDYNKIKEYYANKHPSDTDSNSNK